MAKVRPPFDKPSVALIGLRGSGKSAVGSALADLLQGKCVDTDLLVAERSGKSIAAIFAEEGEAEFRRIEAEVIAEVTSSPPEVISVGGGAVLEDENVWRLRVVATVVWLTAPSEVLLQRTQSDESTSANRPALTACGGPAEIEQLMAERQARYDAASDFTIDTSDCSVEDVAGLIVSRMRTTD